MKEIKIRCTCGSAIEFHDDAESLINSNGSADKKGRQFLIEIRADEWLDRHQKCVDAKNSLLLKTDKKTKAPTGNPHQTM